MLNSPAALLALSAGIAVAAPFSFPLPDGFPNPGNDSLTHIQGLAGGTLSNGPPPTGLDPDTIDSFRLIAFNEIFEVAYFSELVSNITQGVDGYELPEESAEYTVDSLNAVIAVSLVSCHATQDHFTNASHSKRSFMLSLQMPS